jgi:hypothetical protein
MYINKVALAAFMTLLPIFVFSAVIRYDEAEYQLMDRLAVAAGTDKSSVHHNYTRIYSQCFKECKNQPIRFLEIGIYKGDSVRFWEKYFSKADLHFIDITDRYLTYHSKRSKFHYLDQSDIPALQKFSSKEGPFDIILDDGGHSMTQQINSFIALFPAVKSAGLYIIEDLHTSYWTEYGGSGDNNRADSGTAVGFLKNLIDDLNFVGAASGCADADKIPPEVQTQMNYLRDHIASIRFHTSLCIIEKK